MFKKSFSLFIIGLLFISCLGYISAADQNFTEEGYIHIGFNNSYRFTGHAYVSYAVNDSFDYGRTWRNCNRNYSSMDFIRKWDDDPEWYFNRIAFIQGGSSAPGAYINDGGMINIGYKHWGNLYPIVKDLYIKPDKATFIICGDWWDSYPNHVKCFYYDRNHNWVEEDRYIS